jgi:RNA polymerase sigma-70 factor (ECF subfamily)
MDEEPLSALFEAQRTRLRAVAYRILGSVAEADDAVQEAWLRLSRSDAAEIENLGGWLTTVVARICLNVLRSRRTHPEEPLEVHLPDPVIDRPDAVQPEHQALLADAVGLALLTVVQTLPPPERLAFVLHDSFGVPFEEIATIVDKTPAAARQLASRGRRKVQGATAAPEPDRARQRAVVDAFFAAARNGDFDALVAVLDPEIVLRADGGAARGMSRIVRGARAVAAQAEAFSKFELSSQVVLVNGNIGVVSRLPDGRPFSVLGFTIADGKVVEIDILADPDRLIRLDLSAIER